MKTNLFYLLIVAGSVLYFVVADTDTPNNTAQDGDGIVTVSETDSAMNAAIAEARLHLDDFFAHAETDGSKWDGQFIKVGFPVSDLDQEHIWVVDFQRLDSGRFIGRLSNEPANLPDLHFGSKVEFSDDMISDWGFMADGHGYGYYTLRAVIPIMKEQDASAAKAFLATDPLPQDW